MNQKNTYDKWSEWYNFDQIYDYNGPIDTSGSSTSDEIRTWNGLTGPLHTDNGFRLRSYTYPKASFKKIKLKNKLSDFPCALNKGDTGVYWIKIEVKNDRWDYIGECAENIWGIHKRFMDHFSKIAGFVYPFRIQMKDTEKFKEMRDYLNKQLDTSLPDFFNKNVKLAFVKVEKKGKETEFIQKIAKIEGMAMQAYKNRYKRFPKLNKTDETKGTEGMERLF